MQQIRDRIVFFFFFGLILFFTAKGRAAADYYPCEEYNHNSHKQMQVLSLPNIFVALYMYSGSRREVSRAV